MKRALILFALAGLCRLGALEYGVVAHVSRYERNVAEQEFKLLAAAGIRYVRTDFHWEDLEKSPGVWDFSNLDALLAVAERHGIELLPILGGHVAWARPGFAHPAAFEQYVRRVVGRYAGRLRTWEIWNEPDTGGSWGAQPDAAAYAMLLRRTAGVIRAIDPKARIVSGGTSRIPWDYLETLLANGAADSFDVLSVHPYRWEGTPEQPSLIGDVQKLRALLRRSGVDKEIWFTEMGYPTHRDAGDGLRALCREVRKRCSLGESTPVLMVEDAAFGVFPSFAVKNARKIPFSAIGAIAPADAMLIITSMEAFPMVHFEALARFVENGGTLFLLGGAPLFYDLRQSGDGKIQRLGVDSRYRDRLGIAWSAHWLDGAIPRFTTAVREPEFGFDSLWTQIFLQPGGRGAFEPLLHGVKGGYAAPIAGIYRGIGRGNVAVFSPLLPPPGVSESRQAELVTRTCLAAAAAGVGRIYWYELQSPESTASDKESHFGLLHRDLSPKAAFHAYAAMANRLPGEAREFRLETCPAGVFNACWRVGDSQYEVRWSDQSPPVWKHISKKEKTR